MRSILFLALALLLAAPVSSIMDSTIHNSGGALMTDVSDTYQIEAVRRLHINGMHHGVTTGWIHLLHMYHGMASKAGDARCKQGGNLEPGGGEGQDSVAKRRESPRGGIRQRRTSSVAREW